MNPQLKVSGMMQSLNNSAMQVPIKRKLVVFQSGTNGTATVTNLSLGLPVGAKILSLKVKLLNGRRLQASFFPGALMDNIDLTMSGITRNTTAPYNRFPVLSCDVPDTMAKPMPDTSLNVLSVTGSALNSGTTAEFEIDVLASWQANIFA